MEASLPLLKLLAPQIPSISYAALSHSVGLSSTSSKWDLRTAITVQILRNIMTAQGGRKKVPPISRIQARSATDYGVKGKMWIATATIPKPDDEENGIREAVFKAVDDLAEGEVTYTKPELSDIEVEWTGYKPSAGSSEPEPKGLSNEEKYKHLMGESYRTSETTVLYFHGGAYYLADPSTHRALTSKLALECKGRVCSSRYRLAPQTAFPGQLIDALMLYLSLLYPPTGSMHEAIPAEKIVLGGDSAGGNLSFGLLQLLLQMHRSASGAVPVVRFHGRDVHVPLPAGCSANSGWFDISRAMPSLVSNAKWDYLPPANHDDVVSIFPKDDIWPTDPPRGDLFCDLSLLDHPLASLLLADWKTSCPLWLCTGQEMLYDEDALVASQAAKAGVKVQFEKYEAMPHCFALLMAHRDNAERCMKSWGEWARKCVEEPDKIVTNGVYVPVKKGAKEEPIDVATMEAVPLEEAKRLVREAKESRLKGFEKEGKMMPKPAL